MLEPGEVASGFLQVEFGVEGSGFGVSGFGFRVWGLGLV